MKYLLIILTFIIALSCNQTNNHNKTLNWKSVSSYSINFNEKTNGSFVYAHKILNINEIELLIYMDRVNRDINMMHIYELNQDSVIYRNTTHYKRLLHNLPNSEEFMFHDISFNNFNDMYLSFWNYNNLINIDSSQTIKNQIEFKEKNYSLSSSNTNAQLANYKNIVISTLSFNASDYCDNDSVMLAKFSSPTIAVFDFNTLTYKLAIPFPAHYKHSYFQEIAPSISMIDEERVAVSFSRDHNIYIYNTKTEHIDTIDAHSNSVGADMLDPYDRKQCANYELLEKYAIEKSKYYGIYYDKYRELYYRVAIHGVPQGNESGVWAEGENPWSIVVLNKDLKIVGELNFDKKQYDHISLMITKKGLHLMPYYYIEKHKNKVQYDIIEFDTNS